MQTLVQSPAVRQANPQQPSQGAAQVPVEAAAVASRGQGLVLGLGLLAPAHRVSATGHP